ncbi:hypothetical protein Tco_0680300 [Tanacetum coccineum]|uniref:Synaptobrevin, longin-like domain protein n=1 Tax=Tanacetum coccineum TaxID=301880 RepID=A0ABQ4XL33_9ASTR
MVAYLQKSEGSEGFHKIVDLLTASHIRYALTESPTIHVSLIEQFWQTATTSTLKDGDMEITATIDGKVKVVSEASIRRHLKLEDSDGISDLPTIEIFEQLALMSSKKTAWEQFSSNIATAIICLATNRTFNFSKLIFDGMVKNLDRSTNPVESHRTPIVAPSTSQPHHSPTLRDFIRQETEVPQPSSPTRTHVANKAASTGVDVSHGGAATIVSSLDAGHGSCNIDKTHAMPYDSPLLRVHTLRNDKGRMQHNELMDLVTKLSDKVVSLETDLQQTKKVCGAAYTKLIKKVKRLEDKLNKSRRKRKLVLSKEEDSDTEILAQEYPSKQGRKIAQIDEDEGITLVQMGAQTQGRHDHEMEVDFEFTTTEDVSTANVSINTAGAEISTASPKVKIVGVSIDDVVAEGLVYIRRSAAKRKDKGKAIMEESKPTQTKTKLQQEQERLGFKEALRLQEQFNEEERQRIASVHEEASIFKPKEWDNIQAQIKADEELAHRDNLPNKELNKGGTGLSHRLNKVLFEATVKRVNTFTLMKSDDTVPKVIVGSSKRSAEEELGEESSKRQKIGEGSEPAAESKDKESDELSQEQLQQLMIIVPEEGMNSLVQERFNSTEPTEDKERELWVELKRLFEPVNDDELWKSQRYMHDPLTWRLYDTCVVHRMSTEREHDIFMLVEKDYPLTRGLMTLMMCNKLQVDQHSEMADELLRKIFILVNRPRQ